MPLSLTDLLIVVMDTLALWSGQDVNLAPLNRMPRCIVAEYRSADR